MAEVKDVKIVGEELERRIRVYLEYNVNESEAMLSQELAKRIAAEASKVLFKKNQKKILAGLSTEKITAEIMKAVIARALYHLVTEGI